jgi:CubicO group peptidase (beta-lactamase class C family)
MGDYFMKMQRLKKAFPIIIVLAVFLSGCQPFSESGTMKKMLASKPLKRVVKFQPDPHKTLQEEVRRYLKSCKINGSVAIARKGHLIINEGFGYANLADKTLNNAATTFPIASITKTFVATSIMQLQEQGKLNINDPVAKYIPDFPNGKKIKLIHLLSHMSGVEQPKWHLGDTTPLSLLKEIEKRPLAFPAGTKWDYRDANYMILGYILEKVSGMSLHQYIKKNIFAKARIKDAGFITSRSSFTANGYTRNGLMFLPSSSFNPYMLYGCGDIYLSAYDLILYDTALLSGKLVSPKSLELILAPRSKSNYGLGLYNLGYAFFSRGVMAGFEGLHVFYKDRTAISILLNIRDPHTDIHQVGAELHDMSRLYENHK